MKKLMSFFLALIMTVSCLSGAAFAIDPIAEVTNNGKTVKVYSINAMCAAVSETGNTKIKLLADVERIVADSTGQIILPYTCHIDLNGYTWSNVKSKSGNAIKFANVGSQNPHAIVENGTVLGASVCVSSDKGSVEVRNCTLYSPKSIGVSIYVADSAFNDKNLIENCTILAGGANGVFSFQGASPMDGARMTIKNSTLCHINGAGYVLNNKAGGSCTVELGENVDLYALGEEFLVAPGITVTGLTKNAVEGTFELTSADGTKFVDLLKWTTYVEPAPAPVVPETPAAPTTPAAPSVPATGVSVTALGIMALVSLAGAVVTKKH